jgi:hypothetical protein
MNIVEIILLVLLVIVALVAIQAHRDHKSLKAEFTTYKNNTFQWFDGVGKGLTQLEKDVAVHIAVEQATVSKDVSVVKTTAAEVAKDVETGSSNLTDKV